MVFSQIPLERADKGLITRSQDFDLLRRKPPALVEPSELLLVQQNQSGKSWCLVDFWKLKERVRRVSLKGRFECLLEKSHILQ